MAPITKASLSFLIALADGSTPLGRLWRQMQDFPVASRDEVETMSKLFAFRDSDAAVQSLIMIFGMALLQEKATVVHQEEVECLEELIEV